MTQARSREEVLQKDREDLHKLGYAQELYRTMGGFSNFAISFSIISILTGAVILYDYGLAWAGTAAVMIGWPLVTVFVLHRGLDGRDRLGLPDGGRPVLLGVADEEQELGLVDGLAEPASASSRSSPASTTPPPASSTPRSSTRSRRDVQHRRVVPASSTASS